jgi:hypothetical protein
MAIGYSPLHSALPILLQHSYGVSIASCKRLMTKVSQLYFQAPSNIFTLMDVKMDKISSECSRQVMGLSNGFSIILDSIQVLHIVLLEALSMVKKSLSLNIQMALTPPFMLGLLLTVITLRIRLG